jgi:hypothetical protein
MKYTATGGYDREVKKKVEIGSIIAIPLTILAIVGLAALTSNTTTGPGIGNGSTGTSGNPTVTKTFNEGSDSQLSGSVSKNASNGGSSSTTTATQPQRTSSTQSTVSSTSGTSGSTSSSGSSGSGGTTTGGNTTDNDEDCPCQAVQQTISPITDTLGATTKSLLP